MTYVANSPRENKVKTGQQFTIKCDYIVLLSHYFLHIVAVITEGFTPSCDELFYSLLVWFCLCWHWPSCHWCTHLVVIFTSVTATILLQRWNQMMQARRQIPLTSHNPRIFFHYGIIPHVSLFSDRLPYFLDQQVLYGRNTKKWTPFCPKRPLLNDFPNRDNQRPETAALGVHLQTRIFNTQLWYFQHSRRLPRHLIFFISTW